MLGRGRTARWVRHRRPLVTAGAGAVLAVKCRKAELRALRETPTTGRPVDILVELSRDGGQVAGLVDAAKRAAWDGRPLWIDPTHLGPDSALARFGDPLGELERRIEDTLGLIRHDAPPLLPVVAATADDRERRHVRNLLEHQARPVAVRCRSASQHDPAWLVARLRALSTSLGLPTGGLHLVLDEGFVERVEPWRVRSVVSLGRWVAGEVPLGSMTLLAGSTPRQRSGHDRVVRPLAEVDLWEQVHPELGFPLRYGDYGAVHPAPSFSKPSPQAPPNPYLHYTLLRHRLTVARRVPGRTGRVVPSGASARYFREVAEDVVGHRDYAGPGFSWGDRCLHRCRTDPRISVGTAQSWIAYATSHHLAQLSHRPPGAPVR
ncbi:hypothetical protein C1701_22930 [Actinoalloteichus sp. AHMU CJ021]|nr:hypothetical protein C1701_22930 [Actinoalloteichus sp. AHMU CJ021]